MEDGRSTSKMLLSCDSQAGSGYGVGAHPELRIWGVSVSLNVGPDFFLQG